MLKTNILAASFVLATLGSAGAQQSHNTAISRSNSAAVVDVTTAAIAGGPVGAAAAYSGINNSSNVGTLANPQFVVGQTAGAPSTGTFNDCGVAWSAGIGPLTGSKTSESERCVKQRLAQMAAHEMGDRGMALELLCGIDYWNEADKSSGRNQCPAQRAAMAQARPAQVVAKAAGCPVHEVNGQRFVSCP